MTNMIKIDGSIGEGGGQMLRTALALSVLTQKPFEMTNIRQNREKPGLKNQHKYAIEAFTQLCEAKCEGNEVGSTTVQFFPGKIKPKTISVDVRTAGSITLILQSLLIPCILAQGKIKIKLTGGTDTKWSPTIDYFKYVFLPHMRKFAHIALNVEKRGFFPIGNGKVDVEIKPRKIIEINVNEEGQTIEKSKSNDDCATMERTNRIFDLTEQGKLIQIKGVSFASIELQKSEVAQRQAKAAKRKLNLNYPTSIAIEYVKTDCIGSGICLYAVFSKEQENEDYNPIILGADELGEKSKTSDAVGENCAKKLIDEINSLACVDEHLADNLIPYLAIFGGKIKCSKITQHTRTNILICEMFLDVKFEIDEEKKIISCLKAQ